MFFLLFLILPKGRQVWAYSVILQTTQNLSQYCKNLELTTVRNARNIKDRSYVIVKPGLLFTCK